MSGFSGVYPGADRWLGTETAWVGTAPTAGARKIRKEFTAAATVCAGTVTFTYPGGAFPNGIMTVVITPGDNSGSLGFFQVPLAGQSLSVLTAYPWAAASTAQVANGSAIRANIVAVGWQVPECRELRERMCSCLKM